MRDRCAYVTQKGNPCVQEAVSDGFCNIHHPDIAAKRISNAGRKKPQQLELMPIESFDDAIQDLFLIAKAAFTDNKFDAAVKAVKVSAELLSAREASRGQVDLSKLSDEELENLQKRTSAR